MKKGQDTRGYERYLALDIHREYILVGAGNEEKQWVLIPRPVGIEKSPRGRKRIFARQIASLPTTLIPRFNRFPNPHGFLTECMQELSCDQFRFFEAAPYIRFRIKYGRAIQTSPGNRCILRS